MKALHLAVSMPKEFLKVLACIYDHILREYFEVCLEHMSGLHIDTNHDPCPHRQTTKKNDIAQRREHVTLDVQLQEGSG